MADLTPTTSRRRQVRRLRIACKRCRQRKIRCDVASRCGACVRTDTECIYEDDLPASRRTQLHHHSPSPSLTPRATSGNGNHAENRALNDSTNLFEADHVAANYGNPQSYIPADNAANQSENNPGGQRPSSPEQNLSHQVGLVSLSAGVDPKYIGSSSGYFFTQLLSSTNAAHDSRPTDSTGHLQGARQKERDIAVAAFQNIPIGLPATETLTNQLSEAYFDTIHVQYPFLHKPSHERLIREAFKSDAQDGIATFQVTMVLSISALILSRRSHVELPSAGWCAAAVKKFSSLHVENSMRGLQCLLLLMIYAMHSPSSHFNAWSINYQCIAMVVDLGLQREPSRTTSLSLLQREMRTRIFWVVYSLDRKLSTMMGRPIGLRDEACDLRLPTQISDECLEQGIITSNSPEQAGHMAFAVHLFKLARINSEMKYVLHSVNRETPSYAYPAIRDILQWQDNVKNQLDEWHSGILLLSTTHSEYGALLCKTQYHTMKMLLFLPTPGIPHPRPESLRSCYESSMSAIKLFRDLYARDMLVYNWSTCHAVILHAFCLIYCVSTVAQLRAETSTETLLNSIRAASDILSATGEYWAGAKRSRDLLNELASRTILHDMSGTRTLHHDATISTQETPATVSGGASNPNINNDVPFSVPSYEMPHHSGGGTNDGNTTQGIQWDQQDLSFLFDGFPYGNNSDGQDFDIGSLFVDTINFSGSNGEPSDTRFIF